MKRLTQLLVISVLCIVGTATAAEPYGPFTAVGVVSYIDVKQGVIVVNDSEYQLTSSTRTFAANGGVLSVTNIRKGTRVGLVLPSAGAGQARVVGQIHVLPDNYRPLGMPPSLR